MMFAGTKGTRRYFAVWGALVVAAKILTFLPWP